MVTAIALRLRLSNNRASCCRLINSFSTSASKSPQDEENTAESPPPSQNLKHTSIIDGLRSKLQPQQQHNRSSYSSRLSVLNSNHSPVSDDIASSLSEFRFRTSPPQPSGVDATHSVTLEELYNRNVIPEGPESSNPFKKGGVFGLDTIQKKLRQNNQNATPAATSFPQMFANNINPRPSNPNDPNQQPLPGGENRNLSKVVFGSKMLFGKEFSESDKVRFVTYSHKDLGQRLMDLRPEEAKGSNKSFSLEELNNRLMKLRELDRNQPASADSFNIVRESIARISEGYLDTSAITRAVSAHKDFLTPNYMKNPPKEDLVEKYFHPDNMSSAEKMKLNLQKVRDEFKMSESDCGSSRVQVATLTTKIKHLSTTLHKKDKHSRKGLQAMVQKRKKLLKYMRRTDWDSYCLVLSKLGLRDNPDYKS